MLHWITTNLATILVCMVLLGGIVLAIAHMVREKKKGKTSCGCGCTSCTAGDSCRLKH